MRKTSIYFQPQDGRFDIFFFYVISSQGYDLSAILFLC
jgi:hypothetical protein